MVKSEHSETEEEDMDKLCLSSDNSFDTIQSKKRPRVVNDEDETDLPAKKCVFDEQSRMIKSKNPETVCNKIKVEEKSQDPSLSELETEVEEELDKKIKQDNGIKSPLDKENIVLDSSFEEANVENKEPATNTNIKFTPEKTKIKKKDNMIIKDVKDEKEDSEEEGNNDSKEERTKKQHTTKRHNVDTEVVDGLELSVECASDNDESSSESKDEENVKPRPKTIIIKAEPNESELDCSSDGEKSDSPQIVDKKIKSKKGGTKKKNSRTSFSKLKASDSENSQNSNSDEDYSPRTKKKMKKSSVTTKKLASKQSLNESKRGRGRGVKKNSHKKNNECTSDEDEDMITAEREDKTIKSENGTKEELSEKESTSKDESDDNSEKEEKFVKGKKNQRRNNKAESRIQLLKKYLKVAGIRVKCYKILFHDCKSNTKKIQRLLELLEKNGITGRPTIEKCKQARERNAKIKEVSELDMSNIISEGRVTRARRNIENVKKGTLPETPPRHREARNTFRRIQTVVDSDSE